MMFNIPVPGGSSGHAVGAGIIAIIIGPWAAIIAISVTLVLQAMIFGDGGIIAVATNCFNMGVIVPFVAYYAYKFISGNSAITSSTRVIAAAIAGWISLTMASFCAGFELGIQPILEHTAEGVPLYMPYPLSVTIPSMVLEHALVFGILEALITAIIFAYIQRTDTSVVYGEKSKEEMNKMMKRSTI
jgi:cobalt/nickel transport system permease protein